MRSSGPLPRETPACLSYSPATGVTESSFNAFNTTPSVAANIRPPPGLEHMSVMDSGARHPSPLDFLDPLVLPMPGPLGTEPPSFPPKFAAPHVDLEDTPPPPKEPCLRLALLQYLPENEKIVDDQNKSHDTSSCRPCAFYHTKGCALGCKGRRDEKSDLKDFHACLICAFACISATSVNIPVGNAGQNGSQCIFCHICPPGEKKRRQKLRRKAGGSVGCLAAPGCTLPSLAWYAWHRLPRKIPNGAKSIPFLRTGSGLKVALSSIFRFNTYSSLLKAERTMWLPRPAASLQKNQKSGNCIGIMIIIGYIAVTCIGLGWAGVTEDIDGQLDQAAGY